jgi:hypothetical protein
MSEPFDFADAIADHKEAIGINFITCYFLKAYS